MKIGKKVSARMRCPHEVLVASLEREHNAENPCEPLSVVCKFCHVTFEASTGGRCKECKTGTYYCTKECQVRISYIISCKVLMCF